MSGLKFSTTRRQFLSLSGAAVFLYAGRQGLDVGREMVRQEEAWHAAAADNATFMREHARLFSNVTLGTSFAPEQWRVVEGGDQEAMRGFRWMSEEIGLSDVRLGLRWQRIEATPGRIDLSQYGPFLEYAFRNDMQVCLNVGPIRAFRWPEDHLPVWLATSPDLPPYQATIRDDSDIALRATDYFARMLDGLTARFGAEQLASLPMVQVENEPFYRHRGHEWLLSQEYMLARTEQAQAVFPRSKLLVGSAGRMNLHQVREHFSRLLTSSPDYRRRLVMGFDYHYKTPYRDQYPVIRDMDPITYTWGGYETCEENRQAARDMGYDIEVTEGQAEPNGNLTQPGNSARHFRFMLLRCASRVLDTSKPSLIRIWGIEEMAKKALAGRATQEHEAMFDLMRQVNGAALGQAR
ncbi:MAG TPA: hypothetical protein VH951_01595 [Dehalococcoidia bacterium]